LLPDINTVDNGAIDLFIGGGINKRPRKPEAK
jgi:hypothetical protein